MTLLEGCVPLSSTDIPSETTIFLANPKGPYAYLYDKERFREESEFLYGCGYEGRAIRFGINLFHDIAQKPSELYNKLNNGLHGYCVTQSVELTIHDIRATAVTVNDPDLLRHQAVEGMNIFSAPSRQIAASLMLRLAGQPPLYA